MDESQKKKWSEFICSTPSGGRYLASLGSAIDWAESSANNDSTTAAFLARLHSRSDDVCFLANTVDLLRPPYLDFVQKYLHRVLDHLSNEMVRVDEMVGPGLKGNPRWDRTVAARVTGQLRPGLYYSRTAHRSFERPENSLLRWLVEALVRAIRIVARRSGTDGLHPRILKLATACEGALKHHWFSGLSIPSRLENYMILSARRHRRPEYRLAAELAERRFILESDVQHGKWASVLVLLSNGWLEPISPDDLFELYALAFVIDVISSELGFGMPTEFGLVTSGRRHVAKLESSSFTIHVFFDQSPREAFGVRGRYPQVIAAHDGVTGSERRPDILVRCQEHATGNCSTVFVEVKKSSAGRYLSDSVYKGFAYIHDFEFAWGIGQRNPKVILFVPDSVSLVAPAFPELTFVSSENRLALGRALSAGLGTPN